MFYPFLIFVTATFASAVLGIVVYLLLARFGVVDRPNSRSSHVESTVRGGGIGIIAVLIAGILITGTFGIDRLWAAVATLCVAAVSFFDDLKSVRPVWRLVIHTVAACLAVWSLGRGCWLGGLCPMVITAVLAVFWIVGYTNAFNFMDGINGLAASQAIVSALGMAIMLGFATGRWNVTPISVCMVAAGSALGFLPYNFPVARMFMGDVGSAPLGFVLSVLVLWMARIFGWSWMFPLILLHANFILDPAITLVRRIVGGQRWQDAHREHFYQRLIRAGKTHTWVASVEMVLQGAVLLLVLNFPRSSMTGQVVIVSAVIVIWLSFFGFAEVLFRRFQQKTLRHKTV